MQNLKVLDNNSSNERGATEAGHRCNNKPTVNSYLESNNARANTTEKILENQRLLCEEAKQ